MLKQKAICCFCHLKYGSYKCSNCKSMYYCSKECQVADWKQHKSFCKKFPKDIKKILNEYIIYFRKHVDANKNQILYELHDANFDANNSFICFNEDINLTDPFDINEITKNSLEFSISENNPQPDEKGPILYKGFSVFKSSPAYKPNKIVFMFFLKVQNMLCLEIGQIL